MQIAGEWYLCDDGVSRPVVRGEILTGTATWRAAEFLLDTGADRTVFTADMLAALHLPFTPAGERLGGLGGVTESVLLATEIRLTSESGGKVLFRGQYAAVTDPEALDMSVLGRDITGLFAVIVDRPGRLVFMVGQRHSYAIRQVR
jgi:hypothetical protein